MRNRVVLNTNTLDKKLIAEVTVSEYGPDSDGDYSCFLLDASGNRVSSFYLKAHQIRDLATKGLSENVNDAYIVPGHGGCESEQHAIGAASKIASKNQEAVTIYKAVKRVTPQLNVNVEDID